MVCELCLNLKKNYGGWYMKVKEDNPFMYFLNRQLFDGNIFKKVNIILGWLKKLLGLEFAILFNYRYGEKSHLADLRPNKVIYK